VKRWEGMLERKRNDVRGRGGKWIRSLRKGRRRGVEQKKLLCKLGELDGGKKKGSN